MTSTDYLLRALEARRSAHFALKSGLPGRVIFFKAELRRAMTAWKQFAKLRRERQ